MVKDFLGFLLYRIVLDICCALLMTVYGRGVVPRADFEMIVLSYGLAMGMIALAVTMRREQASFYTYLLLLSIVLPMTSLYCYMYPFHGYMGMLFVSFCVLWGTVFFPYRLRLPRLASQMKVQRLMRKMVLFSFLSLFLVVCIRYFLLYGMTMFNLSFAKVYEYRLPFREQWGGIWGYLNSWVMSIILPMTTALFLARRKYFAVACMLSLHVFFFGLSSHKTVLFSGFFVVLLYCILSSSRESWRRFPFFAFTGTLFIAILLALSSNALVRPLKALSWRVFFTPSQMNFLFYDYFSEHGFAYFAHSFLRHFGAVSKYIPSPEFVIGEVYFGSPEMRANTGFLGSGYMEGGFVMVLVYSVILGLMIRHFNKYAAGENRNAVFAVTAYPFLVLFTSVDLPTGIVTGGLWILIITLRFLFPRKLKA